MRSGRAAAPMTMTFVRKNTRIWRSRDTHAAPSPRRPLARAPARAGPDQGPKACGSRQPSSASSRQAAEGGARAPTKPKQAPRRGGAVIGPLSRVRQEACSASLGRFCAVIVSPQKSSQCAKKLAPRQKSGETKRWFSTGLARIFLRSHAASHMTHLQATPFSNRRKQQASENNNQRGRKSFHLCACWCLLTVLLGVGGRGAIFI